MKSPETDIIFSNAAIQNRSYSLDALPGKMAGIMVAQFLNRAFDNPEVIHTWNNVGMFDEAELTDPVDRLSEKYESALMKEHLEYWGIDRQLEIMTDDDQVFSDWAIKVLQNCLDKGTVYVQNADFHVCNNCDLAIAESLVDVHKCGRCNQTALHVESQLALFVNMPEDRSTLLSQRSLFNSINLRQEQSSLSQIPPRLLLSRTRSRGVDLKGLGLGNKKLDPRLGIGLLALYIADTKGYAKGCLVQTASTLMRTVPYLKGVIVDADKMAIPEPFFAVYMKIDTRLLADADLSVVDRQLLLPLASLRRKRDVEDNDLDGIRAELANTKKRVEANIQILKRLGLLGTNHSIPAELNQLVASGRMNDLLPTLNRILGIGIHNMKRLQETDVTDGVREIAQEVLEVIHFYQKILGVNAK